MKREREGEEGGDERKRDSCKKEEFNISSCHKIRKSKYRQTCKYVCLRCCVYEIYE